MKQKEPAYTQQASQQKFQEAIDEYYSFNDSLLDPDGLTSDVADLFRQHDAGHVIFGCDTSLRGETLIDTWTVFGTTAGLGGYLEYFKHPEVNQIFKGVGYRTILVQFLQCIPDVVNVLFRCYKMSDRWHWREYSRYLDQPLCDLRKQFNITVV